MNQKIKLLRETLGLTEKEISSLLNISSYKYVSLEKVGTDIPCEIILLLSRLYNVDVELLINSSFNNEDLMSEISSENFHELPKDELFDVLKSNLLGEYTKTLSYRAVKKIKDNIQLNIIKNLLSIMRENNLSKQEFSNVLEINVEKLDSLFTKKRFIDVDELIIISEKFNVLISDVVFEKI